MSVDLLSYIQQLRAQNTSDQVIKQTLVAAGWNEVVVSEALSGKNPIPTPPPPPPPTNVVASTKPQTGMWDAFEHILMFISLYSMAGAVSLLVHLYIDKWFPGVDTSYGSRYSLSGNSAANTVAIDFSIATLFVTYPLFAFFHLNLKQRTKKNPLIKFLRSRKFLIYSTLVVTFMIAIGNIIGAIFAMLSGNISTNFLMHLFATLVICGLIFAYYLLQVLEDRKLN